MEITGEQLDQILSGVDLNINPYSVISRPLNREERARIVSVLLPALERLAERRSQQSAAERS